MPVTFPAHQGFVLWTKLKWPHLIDATALCIGAAAPDLAYPLGRTLNQMSHRFVGVVVWAIPVTLVISSIVRRYSARGIFASVGDLEPLRLRSYSVIMKRRPPLVATLLSAALGATSHILIDAFTHRGRWGANILGLNRVVGTVPPRGEMSLAGVLQYSGHTLASLALVFTVLVISRKRLLEVWYSPRLVAQARRARTTTTRRFLFWAIVLTPVISIQMVADRFSASRIFPSVTVAVPALLLAGYLCDPATARAKSD